MPRHAALLGDLERTVMDVLWQQGTKSVREVHSLIGEDRDLAYTTVMTVLDRLAKKGVVTRQRVGRSWHYTAAASREALTAGAMRETFETLDSGDRKAALLHFLGEADDGEIADLRAALAEVERQHGDATVPPGSSSSS